MPEGGLGTATPDPVSICLMLMYFHLPTDAEQIKHDYGNRPAFAHLRRII